MTAILNSPSARCRAISASTACAWWSIAPMARPIGLVRTPVGDRYVLERMLSRGYNLGGEPSGHIILSHYATTGDGFVAALQVLAVVQNPRRPVSEACHRCDPLPQILKNVRER